ncbi:MAG TPA: hypothetical protein VNA19_11725 [Pyrinomonadaceae bacterium]|nr:hypothetical protein [Pyrinomonadaceae bacterium]
MADLNERGRRWRRPVCGQKVRRGRGRVVESAFDVPASGPKGCETRATSEDYREAKSKTRAMHCQGFLPTPSRLQMGTHKS